jgi:hypothetical protein
VWSVSGRELQKCRRGRDDFLAVVEEIMNLPREETMSIFALTARGIWRRRNTVVHGRLFNHPNTIAQAASEMLRQFMRANAKESRQETIRETEGRQKWQPLPAGFFKANWDVAISKAMKCMGV